MKLANPPPIKTQIQVAVDTALGRVLEPTPNPRPDDPPDDPLDDESAQAPEPSRNAGLENTLDTPTVPIGYLLLLQISNWEAIESLLGSPLSQELLQQLAAKLQSHSQQQLNLAPTRTKPEAPRSEPGSSPGLALGSGPALESSDVASDYLALEGVATQPLPIALLGPGKFVILSAHQPSIHRGAAFAQSLLDLLQRPFCCGEDAEQEVVLQPVIGLSQWPTDSKTLDGLLSCAEVALAQCHPPSAQRYCFYNPQYRQAGLRALHLTTQLHHALSRNEIRVYYQAQVDLIENRCVGAEALMRWRLPDKSMVSPAEFIPLAEKTGLIVPLGRWILNEACRAAQAWPVPSGTTTPPKISVNLSPIQFYDTDLVQDVQSILTNTGLDPQRLVLEVTEGLLFTDPDKALGIMGQLRALGIQIAIDDFGIGYSSLAALQQFPFTILKIDQSFVRGLMENNSTQSIIQFIINMAQQLQLQIVAEGVETVEELVYLQTEGCGVGQGYYFAPPLPLTDFQQRFL